MKQHLFRFCCGLLITASCIVSIATPPTIVWAPASKKEVAKLKKQIQKEKQAKADKKKSSKEKKVEEVASSAVSPNNSQTTTKADSNPSVLVPMTYYLQTDDKWSDYLYGGSDPIGKYGCGPTVLAMLISSFTDTELTPPDAAEWAVDAGYWSKHSGSYHSIMVYGPTAFGLTVEKFSVYTANAVKNILEHDKVLVCLMGPGHFTESGHFIIINGINHDNTVRILDPYSKARTKKSWKLSTIFNELSTHSDSAGPVWVVSQ